MEADGARCVCLTKVDKIGRLSTKNDKALVPDLKTRDGIEWIVVKSIEKRLVLNQLSADYGRKPFDRIKVITVHPIDLLEGCGEEKDRS